MIILVHTAYSRDTVQQNLGQPEYSYYFVLREFLPILEDLGQVIEIRDPEREVDEIYLAARDRGTACIFLSFMPPNKTPLGLACPTIPVFAWEYGTLPNEDFGNKPRNDWRRVLKHLGYAITHSTFAADAVRDLLGAEFPILVTPAPLWDRLAAKNVPVTPANITPTSIHVDGMLIDSRLTDLTPYSMAALHGAAPDTLPLPAERSMGSAELVLSGVIYTAVFNPGDGRKNWIDMIVAFCEAFRHEENATLLMKLSHHNVSDLIPEMLGRMQKAGKFDCRLILLQGYLPQDDYERLLDATSFTVNCSHGEGQCLPLMEYMSCGKPAISPRHTAMRDYIDDSCAFVVESSAVPGTWPHDQRQAFRTLREHIHYESLVRAYRKSYYVACNEPDTYARMADAAVRSLRQYCSREVVEPRLRAFLQAIVARSHQTDDASAP